ncbi:hypothetical protein [Clostridium hydrogenum]|uniref:hypothetical protein n=1 Tax=Clostridium hydrogenum TaxID=2855764 RepID=UPI001F15F54A|nr:hypothetical protein [Clostridium hydrogenum]
MTRKKKIILAFLIVFFVFMLSFCIGYKNNIINMLSYEKNKIVNFINNNEGKKQAKRTKYVSNQNNNNSVGNTLVITIKNYDVTFNPNDETKNNILKSSKMTNSKDEKKSNLSKQQLTKSYEKQGYIVVWDNDRNVEIIKNNYINNTQVDGVFVVKPSKVSNSIDIYKVSNDGKLLDTNTTSYKKLSDLKAETLDLVNKGLLVFGSKDDAKKLAGYN